MKVAINCAFLQPKGGGIKEYMVNLVKNLCKVAPENQYVVYVLKDFHDYAEECLKGCNVKIKDIPFKTGSAFNKIIRSLNEGRFWRKEEKEEKWRLFHSPFFHAPRLRRVPVLMTVHDLRFYRYPETYARLRAIFLKHAVKRSVKEADHIISISDFTKREIMEAYNVPANKITTIHEAINPEDFSGKKSAKEAPEQIGNSKFILSVGHMEPRKNYIRLIKAFKQMKADHPELSDYKLVIVGKKECYYEDTLKLIEQNPDVIYMNFVDHEVLIWLYRHASLFVFPSLYEGFGFPPLEAAALGVPSAVSNISSIPEVCGDYVIYFDPYDINSMAQAISRPLLDEKLRQKMIERLPDMVNTFSWERNAMETAKLYPRVDYQTLID